MKEVKGLPVRLALLLFTIPVFYLAALEILFNWPTGSVTAEVPGTWSAVVFFAIALVLGILGAALFACNRIRTGLGLLGVSTFLTGLGMVL